MVKNLNQRSKFYRVNEPVPVSINESQRPRSSQYITLKETEWTAYTIDSASTRDCEITLRARAGGAPAQAELMIGERALTVKIDASDWAEIKLGSARFNRGPNQLKWIVNQGAADLDWIEIKESAKSEESAVPGIPKL